MPESRLQSLYQEQIEYQRVRDFMAFGELPRLQGALTDDLQNRARGCLVGLAVGDALGRGVEGMRPGAYHVEEYQGWTLFGKDGTITDDTQLAMHLSRCLLESDGLNPEDLARRFVSERIRGIGMATYRFVRNFKTKGLPWHHAGVDSAGNGAVMRVPPLGLYYRDDPADLKLAAGLQAMVTHNNSMAIASSIILAEATARLLRMSPQDLDAPDSRRQFCQGLAATIEGIEDDQTYRSAQPKSGATLHQRLAEDVPRALERELTPVEAESRLGGSAYVLESLSMALFCFLRTPGDFRQVVIDAVNHSLDSDTVGAIAGALAGALNGYESIPDKYLDELEFREELVELADQLVA